MRLGNKIILLGNGGSGKSTLAKQIGLALDIKVIHLDAHFWKPGWIQTESLEWDEKIKELSAGDSWIMDGNYTRTVSLRASLADTAIYIDMPSWLSLYRIIKRRIMYHNKTRPDMKEGCNERLDLEFIKWVWTYNKKRRDKIIKILEESDLELIVIKGKRGVKEFIKNLNSNYLM